MAFDKMEKPGLTNGRGSDHIRQALLLCTSDFRNALLRVDDETSDSIRETGALQIRRMREQIARFEVSQLDCFADSLEGWLRHASALVDRDPGRFRDGALDVVGLVEQMVDAAVSGVPGQELDRLRGVLARHCAPADQLQADESLRNDSVSEDLAIERVRDVDDTDVEILESYSDEAIDVLDRCELALLRAEIEPASCATLKRVVSDLCTIADAGEAVGLRGFGYRKALSGLHEMDLSEAPSLVVDRLLACVDMAQRVIERANRAGRSADTENLIVPIGEILKRLRRDGRDTALEQGKRIWLDLPEGPVAHVELRVAENMYKALARLLDEAISTSVQMAARRAAAGLSEVARLRVKARLEGDDLFVEFTDDGIDPDAAAVSIQSIDARCPLPPGDIGLLSYRPGFINALRVKVS